MLTGTKLKNKSGRLAFVVAMIVTLSSVPLAAQQMNWSSSFGGHYNEGSGGGEVLTGGGYVVVGSTFSFGAGDYDIYFLKINFTGDTVFSRTFGGEGTDHGYDIRQTSDSGFLIVGSTTSFGSGGRDVYLVRTDAEGQLLWSKTYGGKLNDEGRSLALTPEGGYIVGGTSESFGPGYADVYLLGLDQNGDTLWSRAYGGAGGDNGYSVRRTFDNNYIVIGATGSFGEGYSSVYALKIDPTGDTLWAKTYGGPKADFGRSVEIAQDGGFIIAGRTHSYGSGYGDTYLIKTDSDGNVEWENYFGGSWQDQAYSVCPAADGGYMLAGTTESFGAGGIDIYLVKTDPIGQLVWSETYGGTSADYAGRVVQNEVGDFFVIGHSYSDALGGSDLYILEVIDDSPTPVEEDDPYQLLPYTISLSQNYPNPFNATTSIELSLGRPATIQATIYNILGQAVRRFDQATLPVGKRIFTWDGRSDEGRQVATGIYFFHVEAGASRQTCKMLLMK